MTKAELLKALVSSEDLNAAIVDLVAYIKQNRTTIDANLATVEGKVATLIGSDATKSVRTIANEELAAQLIPANAQEALDTLQEIASWIQSHPGDAAAMNTAITNLQTFVGTLPANTSATTVVGYITAEIAALASQINGMTFKTINGGAITGSGNLVLPTIIEANPEELTSEQCEALRAGDVVVKSDNTGNHSYKVTFKSSTGMCLTYADAENVETIAYDKDNDAWSKTDKTVTEIGSALHMSDFDTIGTTAAKAIVAAAIAAAETPAQSGE